MTPAGNDYRGYLTATTTAALKDGSYKPWESTHMPWSRKRWVSARAAHALV
jgi:hypothetical protein